MSETAKILIIDDDQFILKVAALFLSKSGFTIETSISWNHGMERWMDWKPDLVLLDLMLPEKCGWDILEEMRSKDGYVEVPVIIFTASETPEMHEEAREHGAWGVIPKPFDKKDLLDSIAAALAESSAKS